MLKENAHRNTIHHVEHHAVVFFSSEHTAGWKPGMKTDKPHPQLPLAGIRGHILAGILAQKCEKKGYVLCICRLYKL